MLAWGLLLIGVLSRLFFHIPNFTPVLAIALFGGVYLKKNQALYMPVLLLGLTDIFLGWHTTIPFTWFSIVLISAIGFWLKQHKNFKNIFAASIVSSLVFFIITNLGVWLVGGLYTLDFNGLATCFVAAIPFFKSCLISILVYTFILFGAYELIALRVRNTKFASVVL